LVLSKPAGTYSATLSTVASLAEGLHEGTLTLRLCTDPVCNGELPLRGATLQYSITVAPLLSLTPKVGGVALTPTGSDSYMITSGQTVTITSNLPVTWAKGSSIGAATLTTVSQTQTEWVVTVTASELVGVVGNWVHSTPPSNFNTAQILFHIAP
jgi:hypothetical protein